MTIQLRQLSIQIIAFALLILGSQATIAANTEPSSSARHDTRQSGAASSTIGFSQSSVNQYAGCGAASGDVNGDGVPDLVTSSCTTAVNVLLGKGDGSFQEPVVYRVNGSTQSVALADVNGDGKQDLVIGLIAFPNDFLAVAIMLGNGDGSFQTAQTTTFGSPNGFALSLAVADFNGDKKLDLAVTDYNFGVLWVLVGNGDGTFSTPTQFPQSFGVAGVISADFNHDGKADLAFALQYGVSGAVIVMLNKGDGTFQTPATYPVSGAYFLVASDLTGNGIQDIVVDTDSTVEGTETVSVLLGNGDGTFQAAQQYPSGIGSSGLVAGDFNEDGKQDVAVTNTCGVDVTCSETTNATVSVLLGNGDGTFAPPVSFATPQIAPSYLLAADFNGDGLLDLLSSGGPQVGLLLQTTVGFSSGSLVYAAQAGGTISPPQVVTITNTAATTLNLTSITLGGLNPGDFAQTNTCGNSVAAGATCTITVTFSPLGSGVRAGLVILTDNAVGYTQEIALTGTGTTAVASFTPTSLNFGTQQVNQVTPTQTVTLTNTGNATLNITSQTISGDFLMRRPCPTTVAPGTSCSFDVAFKPSSKGPKTGAVTFTDNAVGRPQTVALSGTGTLVTFSPTSLNFGNVKKGTTSPPMAVTLTNHGTNALNVTLVSFFGGNVRDFAQTNNCGSSVPALGTCTLNVTFTPQITAGRSSNLAVYDSGGGSPQLTPLSGAGVK